MPSVECKNCSSINIVPKGETSFTCNICGRTQEIEPEFDNAKQYLDNTFLGETRTIGGFETVSVGDTSSDETYFSDPKSVSSEEVPPEDEIYYSAVARMNRNSINNYIRALEDLKTIPNWKDSAKLMAECQEKIDYFYEQQDLENAEKKHRIKKRLAVIIPLVLVFLMLVTGALWFLFIHRPNVKYQNALALERNGDVVGAYEAYIDLKGFKESETRAESLFEEYKVEKLKTAQEGDSIYFGSYEQDNDLQNGKEDLKWKVLKRNGSRMLIITEYAIDCDSFNKTEKAVTWETSSIRKTLNTTFLNSAFSDSQRSRIVSSTVKAEKNGNYDSDPGKDTTDKVFLLSINEVEEMMSDEDRQCAPTKFCIAKDCNVQKKKNGYTTCWLLRTPGFKSTKVAYVQYDGLIRVIGANVNSDGATIRPAMWIKKDG